MSETHELLKMEARMIDDALRNDLDLLDRYKVQFEDFRKHSIKVMIKFGLMAGVLLLVVVGIALLTNKWNDMQHVLWYILGTSTVTAVDLVLLYNNNVREYRERMIRIWESD